MIKLELFEYLFNTEEKIERFTNMGFGRQKECKACIAVQEALLDILSRCGLLTEYEEYKESPDDYVCEVEE